MIKKIALVVLACIAATCALAWQKQAQTRTTSCTWRCWNCKKLFKKVEVWRLCWGWYVYERKPCPYCGAQQ